MPKGHKLPKKRRGIPSHTARLDTPSRPTTPAPRLIAAGRKSGREESPPSTIANNAAESTLEDDWVRRTPAAELILPPPKQFADSEKQTFPTPAPPASKPTNPPTRSHTAEFAMRTSLSHTAANATHSSRSHTAEPAMRPSLSHTTVRPKNTTLPIPPPAAPQPAIRNIVVTCLPDWPGHFQVIAAALGHTPNARAFGRGMIFDPKTSEEERTVVRYLTEAAIQDSAIAWNRNSPNTRENQTNCMRKTAAPTTASYTTKHEGVVKPRADAELHEDLTISTAPLAEQTPPTPAPRAPTPTNTPSRSHTAESAMRVSLSHTAANAMRPSLSHTAEPAMRPSLSHSTVPLMRTSCSHAPRPDETTLAAPHTTQHEDVVRTQANAVPHEDLATPTVQPAANQLPTEAEATGRDARRGRRRRRTRAPRPPRMEPPVAAWHKKNMPPSPNLLELRIVRVVVEALTSGIAALRAKDFMPEFKQPWAQSQLSWRTRAGESPAQKPVPGKRVFPAPSPGKEATPRRPNH